MGEAIVAFFQSAFDLIAPRSSQPKEPPKVNGYVADYSPVSNEDIAAAAGCEDAFKTGNWVPVNRRL